MEPGGYGLKCLHFSGFYLYIFCTEALPFLVLKQCKIQLHGSNVCHMSLFDQQTGKVNECMTLL